MSAPLRVPTRKTEQLQARYRDLVIFFSIHEPFGFNTGGNVAVSLNRFPRVRSEDDLIPLDSIRNEYNLSRTVCPCLQSVLRACGIYQGERSCNCYAEGPGFNQIN
jgi:hypothetical protein